MAYLYGLQVNVTEAAFVVSGRTFDHKEKIKAIAGSKWSPADKAWTLPLDADLSTLLAPVVVSRPAAPKVSLWGSTRNTWRRACCSQCKNEFDKYRPDGPMWFVCPVHGTWKSDYSGD